jgi:hypothetical protein
MTIDEILALDDGTVRTAALVEWLQGLHGESPPVLVGGAAVELYTGGASTTGDIDLVGVVTPDVQTALEAAGFTRHGRHWIHETTQTFIEFPGDSLDPEERADWQSFEGRRIRIVSAEDLLVDRLGAWEYWSSSVDGMNAWMLWQAQRDRIDRDRLEARIEVAGWSRAWRALQEAERRWTPPAPSREELEHWARVGP